MASEPSRVARPPDVDGAHAAIEAAIAAGEPAGLRVLGYGEMTLVVGWPTGSPTHAVKRLPPFATARAVEAYAALVRDYVGALAERGVASVPTDVVTRPARGGIAAYLVQPMAPPERLLDGWLQTGPSESEGLAALTTLAEAIARGADERVGLDGQVSNWVRAGDGGLALVDLTTPMLRDARGRERLDMRLFTSVYPWVLRGALRRFVAPGVVAAYHRPRSVIIDAASNLMRENLDEWVPVLLRAAGAAVDRPPTAGEVGSYYRSNTRLWAMTERLRRAERWWQRRVRRRDYPMLLAPPGSIRPARQGAGGARSRRREGGVGEARR
ncbi:MAG: DUF6206 family protein [Solirubrobacteraceae bacterium]